MDEGTPEATELVYLPESSWDPVILAFSLGLVLAGVLIWFPYGVIGGLLAIAAIARMFRTSASDVDRLPRRQKLTTAVIPAVPPRKRDS